MSKKARSARGELVDFDLLAIKQQLALTPVPVGVNERRKFIDEKDGLKSKVIVPPASKIPEAMQLAVKSVSISADTEMLDEMEDQE